MPKSDAIFWLCVVVLLAFALLLGQFASVAIAAMAGVVLAYRKAPTLWKPTGNGELPDS